MHHVTPRPLPNFLQARNAFCAVRPPGHHAGPSGVVPNANDAAVSHGFCLFSNIAVGAGYAMSQYRHQGRFEVSAELMPMQGAGQTHELLHACSAPWFAVLLADAGKQHCWVSGT